MEVKIRVKRIWGMSRDEAVKQAKIILEYRLLAITLCNLELDTDDAGIKMGELWAKREKDPKLESTAQAKSNPHSTASSAGYGSREDSASQGAQKGRS